MKKKIALLLAAAMTVSMLPTTAFASSSNKISRSGVTVKEDKKLKTAGSALELQITPQSEVTSTESIIINVENGEFFGDEDGDWTEAEYAYYNKNGQTWSQIWDAFKAAGGTADAAANVANQYVGSLGENALPYNIKAINDEQIEVQLFPLAGRYADVSNSGTPTQGKPVYQIKLPITSTDEGDIKISVDSNGSSISATSSLVVGTTTSGDGSTTASVSASKVKATSNDDIDVPDVTVKEDVKGTFKSGKVKFRVNGQYTIANAGTLKIGLGANNNETKTYSGTISSNSKYVEFNINEADFDADKISSIIWTGARVSVDDSDSNWGDVTITVSGDDVTTQTVTVATREDYGFALTTLEEAPTIFAGRTPVTVTATSSNGNTVEQFGDLDEDDFKTAKFRFAETTPNTWLTSRKLEFKVPDGVKIIGADLDKNKYFKGDCSSIDGMFEKYAQIADDGQTLRISSIGDNNIDSTEASYLDLALYITTEASYTGDVTVSVAGAGLDADQVSDVTIAKVVAPVTIESSATKANLGYQAMDTADITITENAVGAFVEDKEVKISVDSLYGEDELGFADDDTEIVVNGELEVKNFKVSKGVMTFKIDGASYNTPSSVTIKNVKIGTTRSIPYGSYDIQVGGEALVNNYADTVDSNSKYHSNATDWTPTGVLEDESDAYLFDTDEGYKYKGYLQVVTETGTLDGKVAVTIGEKAIEVNGEKVETDVAAYIQTSSNSTLVPLRMVALAIGVDTDAAASVDTADQSSKILWDANTKTATVLFAAGNGQKIVKFQAGSNDMVIDGTSVAMENDVTAEITDGRLFVPFRALGQALGVSVSWDADTRTAFYNADSAKTATVTTVEATEATTAEETTEATTEAE